MPAPSARLYGSAPLLLCVAVLGWSGNFVVGRLVGGSIPPIQLGFLRWFIASLIVVPFAWHLVRRDAPELRRRWVNVLTLSVTGVAIFNTFVYHGLQTTTAVNGLLLQSVCPVLIVLITFAAHHETPHVAQAVGLVVSLVGVCLVVSRGGLMGGPGVGAGSGDLWILAAVASYAVYTVALRTKPAVHPVSLLAVTFVVGDALLLPFAAAELAGGRAMPATAGTVAAVLYVALVPSIVSYFCFNRGVELAGGARAGQFMHLMPVFGAALAFVFIGERLAWYHFAGAAVIAAGIRLSSRGAAS